LKDGKEIFPLSEGKGVGESKHKIGCGWGVDLVGRGGNKGKKTLNEEQYPNSKNLPGRELINEIHCRRLGIWAGPVQRSAGKNLRGVAVK